MVYRLIIVSCFLHLVIAFSLTGQKINYYLKTFSLRDGLPNNAVKWITQDQSGFLWIGTWDGLVRYDGSEFKVYRHDPNDSTSIGNFEVTMIGVDAQNQIWTYSANKLCRYERAHDHFIRYDKYDFPESDSSNAAPLAFNIFVNPEKQLYVRFNNGLYKYHQTEDNFREIYYKRTRIELDLIYSTSFDNEGNVWMFEFLPGKEYGLVNKCFINEKDTLSIINTYPVEKEFFCEILPSVSLQLKVISDCAGNAWIASSHGLYRLSEDTIREFHGKIPSGEFLDQNILLWSQPGKGLMVYYPAEGKQDTIFKRDEVENVVAYYSDKQNNIWFTNYNPTSKKNGLVLIYRTGNNFKQYLNEIDEAIPSAVFGLIKDNSGNIWAGGRPNDHIVKISPDGEIREIKVPMDSIDFYNTARDMALDLEGNIWIAFYYDYLYRLNPKNNEFTDYSNIGILSQYSYYYPRFRLVKTLKNGRLILSGRGRIYVINKNDFSGTYADTPYLTDSYSFFEDNFGHLWMGLNGQLMKSDVNLSQQEIILISGNNYNIEDICPGDSSDLWLAFLGGGIGHFVPETDKTTFFTTSNGLAHNTVYSIKKDKSGNLWASHDLGISMLNPRTKNIVNFNEKDGLQIREFDSEAAYQMEDGELLFGGVGGIVSFYPDSVIMNRQEMSSQLLITDFRVSNIAFNFNLPLSDLKSIQLPKGTDNFQLEMVKPDFRFGEEIRYRYKLNGISEDWIITDSRHRRVNYTSLRPGNYEFQAEATDLNGDWKFNTSLLIDIPPFFYQTYFFKIIIVLVSLGILMLFFSMKLKQTRLKEKKKKEQLKLETLRGQMNPHFIYNSLNSINYFISLNDKLNANQYITDFSRLMRAILTNSSQDYISLESEIQTLWDYLSLEHLRFSEKFDFEIIIDEKMDQITTEVIPSLVQPFIENAIWHGLRNLERRKGFLSVRFIMENESELVCYVEDDGIGRKLSVRLKSGEQKRRRSRGIAIVEERLGIINSFQKTRFSVQVSNLFDDREETGTRVRIEIPFKTS